MYVIMEQHYIDVRQVSFLGLNGYFLLLMMNNFDIFHSYQNYEENIKKGAATSSFHLL